MFSASIKKMYSRCVKCFPGYPSDVQQGCTLRTETIASVPWQLQSTEIQEAKQMGIPRISALCFHGFWHLSLSV